MYAQYQERKEDRDAKAKAKRARQEANTDHDDEFEGFAEKHELGNETDASSDADLVEDEDDDDAETDEEDVDLLNDLRPKEQNKGALSGRAASFFQQDLFKDIGGIDEGADSEAQNEDKGGDSGVDVDSPELKLSLIHI